MRLFWAIGIFCFLNSVSAQKETARKWLDSLTSPQFHGRGYVQDGDKLAAQFLERRFKEFGAKPYKKSYFQPFQFEVNTFPGNMEVVLNGKTLTPGVDYVVDPASGGGEGTWNIMEVTLQNLGSFTSIFQSGKASEYCFVYDFYGIKDRDTLAALKELARLTAEKSVVITLQADKFTWSVSANEAFKMPYIWMQREAYQSLINEANNTISLNIEQELKNHQTQNVIGYIPGRNKKTKSIVITAHYDHLGRMGAETIFPGASDNASGVSMMLTLMEHYAQNQPEQTIVFMAFAAEEAGILGSKYYTENPLFPLKNIRFLINIDLAGTGDDGITVVNGTEFKDEFLLLSRINQEKQYLKEVRVRGRAANSDHYWFTLKGVPCFFIYTMGGVSHYHDIYDVAETLPLTKFNEYHQLLLDFIAALK